MAQKNVTRDITTGIGTLSFPRVFKQTATTNDKGELVYECQIIIPKTEREALRSLLSAIKEVGEAKWGTKWKQVRNPLRDGDKEADELTEDGSTKGEKYPERLGAYFLNARSKRPIAVVDRDRSPISEESEIYGGCKGRLALQFYPYFTQGNHGIAASLNGVQKTGEGEPFGSGAPSTESMFDLLDDADDLDLDDVDEVEEEVEEAPAKKAPAKKAPAKKRAAKKVEPEEIDEDDLDDEDDIDIDDEL